MSKKVEKQISADFSVNMSLLGLRETELKLVSDLVGLKMGFGSSGLVRPGELKEEHINEEAKAIADIEDKSELEKRVKLLLLMLYAIGRDGQWIAEWAQEAHKTIQRFPEQLRVLQSQNVVIDEITKVQKPENPHS